MTDDVLTVAEVAALVSIPAHQISLYAWRAKCRRAGSGGIPVPDAQAADELAWHVDTIQQWLDERKVRNGHT